MGLGINSNAYRNTGTHGTPTWVAVTNISDCQVNPKWNSGDGSTRGSPVMMSQATQLDLNVTFKMLVDTSTNYTALATAFWTRAEVDMMFIDGTTSTNGSEGVRFIGQLFNFAQSQNLDQVLFRDCELKPNIQATNKPQTVAVTSGAPVFTTIA